MKTFSFFFTTSLLLLFVVSLRVTAAAAAEGSEGTTFVATEPRHHNAHHKHSTALGSGDTNHGIQSPHTARHYERARRLLRSGRCEHVYLDLGSNIGIQIRKLYEPQYYPRARFLQVFNEKFGIVANTSKSAADLAARSNVCAFGFEPNPHFTHRLSAIEEAYTNIGFPIVMFTETAIGVTPANVSFFLEPTVLPKVHEWGASMLNWHGNMTQITAGSVVLSDFILHSIKNRKGQTEKSQFIAKLDVEGMEFTILPDLLIKKAICDMNMIMCEFHKRFVKDSPNNVTSFLEDYNFITHKVKGCKGRLVDIDDESYGTGDDPSPLPGRIDSAMGRRLTLNGHNNQQKPLKKIHSRVEDSVRNEAEMRIINEFEELRKVNLIV